MAGVPARQMGTAVAVVVIDVIGVVVVVVSVVLVAVVLVAVVVVDVDDGGSVVVVGCVVVYVVGQDVVWCFVAIRAFPLSLS